MVSLKKQRLDALLVQKGLARSRQHAQSLILAHEVLVQDEPATKPGLLVHPEGVIRLRSKPCPYVSRGAYKLLGALDAFEIDCQGKVALDVGSSTGGFTEVLLERGASRVIACDVGTNQLDYRLRVDPRVMVLENTNARYLVWSDLNCFVDIIVMDVSFISQTKIYPALKAFRKPGETVLISLIKPQFEVGREKVGKKGIVIKLEDRLAAVDFVCQVAEEFGIHKKGCIESPLPGVTGNQEYLFYGRFEI